MERDDLCRLASYLYAAVQAGRATKDDWRRWADRMIEAGVTPDWILGLSLAKSKDQATPHLGQFGPIDGDVAVGHLWRRYQLRETTLREFLVEAECLSDYRYARFEEMLEDLDAGRNPSTILPEIERIVERLAVEADRQWRELYPES